MIVVDSNVFAYCWILSDRTELAQRVCLRDPDWHGAVLIKGANLLMERIELLLRDGAISSPPSP